jgi:ElaB/YqjD/DUF883 family membrane-anchored ribosome-binding protein
MAASEGGQSGQKCIESIQETVMNSKAVSADKLMEDLRLVVTDAEELLRATAGQAGEKVAAARARAAESIDVAKARIAQAGYAAAAQTREAARAADEYVHDNPWAAVGVAAAVGVVIGILIAKK